MAKQKFHIGKNGPAPCNADKRACRYGGEGENHYDTMEDADKAYQAKMEESGNDGIMSKKQGSAPLGSEQNPAGSLDELPGGTGVMVANGTKYWHKNGVPHREDGPAVETGTGTKIWYRNGQLHREDGPAVETIDGNKEWYQNDVLHRENGPAIENPEGNEYWIHGEKVAGNEGFHVGTEQNPAKSFYELPEGTGFVVDHDGRKKQYQNGIPVEAPALVGNQPSSTYADKVAETVRNSVHASSGEQPDGSVVSGRIVEETENFMNEHNMEVVNQAKKIAAEVKDPAERDRQLHNLCANVQSNPPDNDSPSTEEWNAWFAKMDVVRGIRRAMK